MKWTPLDKMDSMDKMDNMDKIRQFRPKNAKFHKSQSEGLRKRQIPRLVVLGNKKPLK